MAEGKRISKHDLYEPKPLADLISDARAAKSEMDALAATLNLVQSGIKEIKTESSGLKGGIVGGGKSNVQDIEKTLSLTKQMNTAYATYNSFREEEKTLIDQVSVSKAKQQAAEQSLQKQRERYIAMNEKASAKELANLEKQRSAYARFQNIYASQVKIANDIAVRKNAGFKLTEKETKTLDIVAGRIQKVDAILKTTDASMGRYQRNVGNYASGWNGLSNSINQLTREAPAFAVSMNTGFLAISNNLPQLIDEISRLRKANIDLAASGKPTTSVLKQIGASLFSLQTGISLAVTLLTVYGGQIVDFFSELFKGKEKIDAVAVAQEGYNNSLDTFKSSITEAATKVKLVGASFELARRGVISKKEALETYNTELGDVLGKATSLNEAEEIYANKAAAFIKATSLRARAMKLFEMAAEEMGKSITAAAENQVSTLDKIALGTSLGLSTITGDYQGFVDEVLQKQKEGVEAAKQAANTREAIFERQGNVLLREAAQLEVLYDLDINGADKSTKAHKERIKVIETELKLIDKFLSGRDVTDLNQLINQESLSQSVTQLRKQADALQEIQLRSAELGGPVEFGAIESTTVEEFKIRRKLLVEQAEFEIELLALVLRDKLTMRRRELDDEYNEQRQRIQDQREELKKQGKLTLEITKSLDAEENKLDNQYLARQKTIAEEEVELEKKKAKEIELINLKLRGELDKLSDDEKKRIEELRKELETAAPDDLGEIKNKTEKDKKLKEDLEMRKGYIDALTEYFKKKTDERIAMIDREIAASKKQTDFLEQKAANGVITAQESLTLQNEIEAQALREKEKLERQKAALEFASTAAKILDANITEAANDNNTSTNNGTAFAKSIADVAVFKQLIAQLASFEKGTEDTGNNHGAGIDGKGGFLSILHPKEGVMEKGLNEKKLQMGYTNADLIRIAENHRVNELNAPLKRDIAGNSWDIEPLVNKLDGVEKAIKKLPETMPENKYEFAQVSQFVGTLTHSRRKGGRTTQNIFTIR